jgi:hypothetical protein
LSDDPDTATQQTVHEMCVQIHQAANDPVVQSAARDAQRFQGGPDHFSPAEACWWWAKHYLRFRHHGEQFEVWRGDLGDPRNKLQLLIAPDVLVRMSRMEGDCAIYTMMLCAMLEALDIQWEIVTAAVDARQPEIFGHVWPRAVLPGGNREPLDASHGKYPGWQVPAYDLHRVWVFNSDGQRIGEQRAGFTGLHAYRRRRGFGRHGLGTMVCDDTGENCYDDGTTYGATSGGQCPGSPGCPGYVDPNASTTNFASLGVNVATLDPSLIPYSGALTDSSGTPYTGSAYSVPSQSSAQWAAFATAMGKAGMTLAEINAIQPGTVVSANGTILRQATGIAVPGTTLSTTLGSMSSSTLMIVGVVVIGALLLMGRK